MRHARAIVCSSPQDLHGHARTSTASSSSREHHVHRPVAVDRDHPRARRGSGRSAGTSARRTPRSRSRHDRLVVVLALDQRRCRTRRRRRAASAGRSAGGNVAWQLGHQRRPESRSISTVARHLEVEHHATRAGRRPASPRAPPPGRSCAGSRRARSRGAVRRLDPLAARAPRSTSSGTRLPFSISGLDLAARAACRPRSPSAASRRSRSSARRRCAASLRRLRPLPGPGGAEEDHAHGVCGAAGVSGDHESSCLPCP